MHSLTPQADRLLIYVTVKTKSLRKPAASIYLGPAKRIKKAAGIIIAVERDYLWSQAVPGLDWRRIKGLDDDACMKGYVCETVLTLICSSSQ